MRALSRNILTEIKDNLDKNQKARNELYDLLDKAYYVDSIKYKIDDTRTYLEGSGEWIVYDSELDVIVIILRPTF